ncbi:MAG: hypothetical protein NCW75_05120 [Phycisphaera sp.]|nr:MAG: hypothetical protein NCW75_05120 [Phycisphaera sp.]
MKKMILASMLAVPAASLAQGLTLEYTVEDLGGTFEYEFFLNTDGGWASGMGWRWFIWGDCVGPCTSPLTDWVGDPGSLPVGPWTGYSSSSGGHNGPTFSGVLDYWIPADGSEELTWKGTSSADLAQGELLFSTIAGTVGGAQAADYQVADRLEDDCYADLDGDGELTLFDFLAFQNAFDAGDSIADCDGDGDLTLFDFLCFQNAFDLGCE